MGSGRRRESLTISMAYYGQHRSCSRGIKEAEYDAWLVNIMEGDQFSSGFVTKPGALVDHSTPTPTFESARFHWAHLDPDARREMGRHPCLHGLERSLYDGSPSTGCPGSQSGHLRAPILLFIPGTAHSPWACWYFQGFRSPRESATTQPGRTRVNRVWGDEAKRLPERHSVRIRALLVSTRAQHVSHSVPYVAQLHVMRELGC